jgi:hypothetical protein
VSARLRDYELKRRRAIQHFSVLRESVERFANIAREPVAGAFDSAASKYRFEVPLEPIDPEWTLLLGDFVYDTRASLNYLVTALVRSTGNEENQRHEFPIYGIERVNWRAIDEWWESDPDGVIKRKLKDTPDGTKAALKTLQPFYGVPRTDPFRHPLAAVQLLTNRDKHRRLNLLARGAAVDFLDAEGQPIYEGPAARVGRLVEPEDGNAYTATLAVDKKLGVDVYLRPAYHVRLHEPPQLFGDVVDTLRHVNEFIDNRVLPTVTPLLYS